MRFRSGLVTVSSFLITSTMLVSSAEHSQPVPRATYDTYQAGVVVTDVPKTFRQVTASLITPWMFGPPGSGANIFVAIDGEHCNNVSLRAGVKGHIYDHGSQAYTPYYQWFPNDIKTFGNVTVSSGDTISLTVTAMDEHSGNVYILTDEGESIDEYLTFPTELCQMDALWIVEPLYDAVNYTFYPLARFSSIIFEDASAFAARDSLDRFIFPSDNPVVLNITENNQAVTIAGVEGASIMVSHL